MAVGMTMIMAQLRERRCGGAIYSAGKGTTLFEIVANRYYSRNFFDFYTRAKRLALQTSPQTRRLSCGVLTAWSRPQMSDTWTWLKLADMKTQYT